MSTIQRTDSSSWPTLLRPISREASIPPCDAVLTQITSFSKGTFSTRPSRGAESCLSRQDEEGPSIAVRNDTPSENHLSRETERGKDGLGLSLSPRLKKGSPFQFQVSRVWKKTKNIPPTSLCRTSQVIVLTAGSLPRFFSETRNQNPKPNRNPKTKRSLPVI